MERGLQAPILWKKVVANIKLCHILIGLTKQKQHISICFCKENKGTVQLFWCISQNKQVKHKSSEIVMDF